MACGTRLLCTIPMEKGLWDSIMLTAFRRGADNTKPAMLNMTTGTAPVTCRTINNRWTVILSLSIS